MRPGVPGLSDNIQVTSIIDRFLEHARIYYFYHGGDRQVYLSSADMMPRNLDRRVELLVPILASDCKKKAIQLLELCLSDNVKARHIQPDGTSRKSPPSYPAIRSQEEFQQRAIAAEATAFESKRMTFTPVEPGG